MLNGRDLACFSAGVTLGAIGAFAGDKHYQQAANLLAIILIALATLAAAYITTSIKYRGKDKP